MAKSMHTSAGRTWSPVANPEMAAAFADIRRSSKASPHQDRRNRRARTKQTVLNRTLREDH